MKKIIRNVFITTVFILIAIIVSSCSKNSPLYGGSSSTSSKGGPGANEVWIQGMAFTPASITVKAGTTIKWTNKDAINHTVTADDGSFDSGILAGNGTFSHTFASAGSFGYHCKIHSYMTATVIVQ